MRNEYSSTSMQQQQHNQLLSAVNDVTRSRSGDSTEPVAPHAHGHKTMYQEQQTSIEALVNTTMTDPSHAESCSIGTISHNVIPHSPIRPPTTHCSSSGCAGGAALLTPAPAHTYTPSLMSPSPFTPAANTITFLTTESAGNSLLPALVTPLRPGAIVTTTLPQRRTRVSATAASDMSSRYDHHQSVASLSTSTMRTNTIAAVEEGSWRTKELSGVFREDSFSFVSSSMDLDGDYPDVLSIRRTYAFDEDDAEV